MAKVKSELKNVFEAEGFVNSTSLEEITLENLDEGIIDLAQILRNADGKFTKIVVTTTDSIDVPILKDIEHEE